MRSGEPAREVRLPGQNFLMECGWSRAERGYWRDPRDGTAYVAREALMLCARREHDETVRHEIAAGVLGAPRVTRG